MNFRLQYALALAVVFAVAMALTLQRPPVVTGGRCRVSAMATANATAR